MTDIFKIFLEIFNLDTYIQKPRYLLVPIILTAIFVIIMSLIEETATWTFYQWASILIVLPTLLIVLFGVLVKIKRW